MYASIKSILMNDILMLISFYQDNFRNDACINKITLSLQLSAKNIESFTVNLFQNYKA